MTRSKWFVLAAFSLFLIVAAAACQNQSSPVAPAASESPVLTDLESIEQLQTAFNDDSGNPRLLMILAPL